ncbi:MAG: hypothetical protein VW378_01110 [bacterium]
MFLNFLLFNLYFFVSFIFALTTSFEHDLPARRDYRELMTATSALENQLNKKVKYMMQSQTPGYVRETYLITHNTNKDTGLSQVVAKSTHKWISGRPVPTERVLDFCLSAQNKAFFKVQLDQGRIGYTRDGHFRIDYLGRLVTVAGNYPVLGENGPIIIDGLASDVVCSRSGVLFLYNQRIDKLDIAVVKYFLDLDAFSSPNGVIFLLNWEVEFLESDDSYAVLQGYLEQSNSFLSFDSWYEKQSYQSVAKSYYKLLDSDKKIIQAAAP